MMDEMASTMGGRAAEEIINGQISTGALNDLEKVTKQAYAMVSYFGMSRKIGHLSFYDSQESGYNFNKPYSEKTAEIIDKEAKDLIDIAHEQALHVLRENMEGFTQLANLLLSREVIFTEDMERIFGKRKQGNNTTAEGNSSKENSTKEKTSEEDTSKENDNSDKTN
jgi:ATP-dependent Zn proteases